MVKTKMKTAAGKEVATKGDLNRFKEEIIHEFHLISEGLIDQIKLLAEGHSGIVQRLDRMEKENERQHLETRSLVKISFSELDRRISELESQVRDLQEWRKEDLLDILDETGFKPHIVRPFEREGGLYPLLSIIARVMK